MKENYENRFKFKLARRTPAIIRIDGKAFHTFTRKMKFLKPFSNDLHRAMVWTAQELCKQIQGVKCAYIQSDEISLLLTDFDKLETGAWFDYEVQKIASVSASIATSTFNNCMLGFDDFPALANFDARVFNIPREEVANYFIWRQKDWQRNSLSMFARSFYRQKELMNKSGSEIHEMLHKKGENWTKLVDVWKRGTFLSKENNFMPAYPEFVEDRKVIEDLMVVEDV